MYLLFDIGGTNMRLAVSRDGKTLGDVKKIPTPQSFEDGMRHIGEMAHELAGGEKFTAAAGGIAGPLNREHTMAVRTPNIAGWDGKPLKTELEHVLDAPVYLENDAALAGLGEASMGAARGYGIVVYVTVSTGVGGVRIVDGAIDRNAMGFEIGHQIINYDGETRTLEENVSGSGFLRRFGKPASEMTDPAVWEEAAQMLAYGLHNTILHWSPDILVLGGPLILQSLFPFESFKKYLTNSILAALPSVPEIKKVELGDVGGLHGALVFLHTKFNF